MFRTFVLYFGLYLLPFLMFRAGIMMLLMNIRKEYLVSLPILHFQMKMT